MRRWPLLFVVIFGCAPPAAGYEARSAPPPPAASATVDTAHAPTTTSAALPTPPPPTGVLDNRLVDFVFEGGQLEFEMIRSGLRVTQIARSRFAVPVVVAWNMTELSNLTPANGATSGVVTLPPGAAPGTAGPTVVVAELQLPDVNARYFRHFAFRARFGDPQRRPAPYAYALPYAKGSTYTLIQGFHGAFSHTGSNEYAVDFDCPVGTPVRAMRPGLVVAANGSAQATGTTPEFLDYDHTNFIVVAHEDGTLGEYLHLAPNGLTVHPGQRVDRLQQLALSGNTGYSRTPHLHFQVMTASPDGRTATSFPFKLAVAAGREADPVEGQRYGSWE